MLTANLLGSLAILTELSLGTLYYQVQRRQQNTIGNSPIALRLPVTVL